MNPPEADAIALDDPSLIALKAYFPLARRGVCRGGTARIEALPAAANLPHLRPVG